MATAMNAARVYRQYIGGHFVRSLPNVSRTVCTLYEEVSIAGRRGSEVGQLNRHRYTETIPCLLETRAFSSV
jgi:hypothetical protein